MKIKLKQLRSLIREELNRELIDEGLFDSIFGGKLPPGPKHMSKDVWKSAVKTIPKGTSPEDIQAYVSLHDRKFDEGVIDAKYFYKWDIAQNLLDLDSKDDQRKQQHTKNRAASAKLDAEQGRRSNRIQSQAKNDVEDHREKEDRALKAKQDADWERRKGKGEHRIGTGGSVKDSW